MSQYPLDTQDGVIDAVNYLLSGPSSTGQNFQGVSATAVPSNNIVTTYEYDMLTNAMAAPFNTQVTDTGNVVTPSSNAFWPQLSSINFYGNPPPVTVPNCVITGITVITAEIIDVAITVNPIDVSAMNNAEFAFTPYGPYNPFVKNQRVDISTVTPPVYNGAYRVAANLPGPGISTIRLIRLDGIQPWTSYVSGGQIDWQNQNVVTDLSGSVTVTGPTDRVFITCQAAIKGYIFNPIYTTLGPGLEPATYELRINRYRATAPVTLPDGAQPFPLLHQGYAWQLDANLVTVPYNLFPLTPGIIADGFTFFKPDSNSTFNNVIDQPGIGYFLYTFEIYFNNQYYDANNPTNTPNIKPIAMAYHGFRSFTAQVIKA